MKSQIIRLILKILVLSVPIVAICSCDSQPSKMIGSPSRNLGDFGITNVDEFPSNANLLFDDGAKKICFLQGVNTDDLARILGKFSSRGGIVSGSELKSSTIDTINYSLKSRMRNQISPSHVSENGAFSWGDDSDRYRCHYVYLKNKDLYLQIYMPSAGSLKPDWSGIW